MTSCCSNNNNNNTGCCNSNNGGCGASSCACASSCSTAALIPSASSSSTTTSSKTLNFSAAVASNSTAGVMTEQEREELITWIEQLPKNYNFELEKSVVRIRQSGAKRVALQFPEGLLLFGCAISDLLKKFCPTVEEVVIMGDVTYGACCIDDFTAKAMNADFMIHYAHSCLIPVTQCKISNILYVFVDIQIDLEHFIQSVIQNFDKSLSIAFVSTIQFVSALRVSLETFKKHFKQCYIPQIKPLSPGEILGCTSPNLSNMQIDKIIYLGDGRFHLESIMIHNPSIEAYKYDPYSKKLTREQYDQALLLKNRMAEIKKVKEPSKTKFGIILGTLGRQGSTSILDRLTEILKKQKKPFIILLLSEIYPNKLAMFKAIDCWVQIACPRLSIDWGHFFDKPLLTPYEAMVLLGESKWVQDEQQQSASSTVPSYPMDFYANNSGPWTVRYEKEQAGKQQLSKEEKRALLKSKLSQMKQQQQTA